MSRMSELYVEIEELVYDAITAGYTYENEIVSYVNACSRLKVDRETVKSILHSGSDYWDQNESNI